MDARTDTAGPRPGAPPVRILGGQAGSETAARGMRKYLSELSERLGTETDPSLTHADDPADVTPPRGDFMLLSEVGTGMPLGFGAVYVLEPGVVEIKRMWLKPDVRGRGLGKFLLKELENRARSLGAVRVLLAVNESLVEACGLYLSAGYHEVEPFEENPYATHFFGKQLVR